MKTPLSELHAAVVPFLRYTGRNIRHKKTKVWYRVTGFVYLESKMTIHFTYCPLNDPVVVFCRPIDELLDERFEFEG